MRGGSPAVTEARGIVAERSFEASFLYDLAMVHLALAEPERAAEDFLAINTLVPEFQLRPVMELYYQQIAEKSLPTLAVPTLDDEIAVRFPPKPADAAPTEKPAEPPSDQKGESPAAGSPVTPPTSPEPPKPAEQPKAEEKK